MATIDAYTESNFDFNAEVTIEIKGEEQRASISMSTPIDDDVEVELDEDQIEEVLDQHVNDPKFIFNWMINSDLVGEFTEHVLSPETADNWGEDVAKPLFQALFEGDTKGLFDFIFGKTKGEYNNPVSDQTDVLDDLRSKLGPETKAYLAEQLAAVPA
tara:strand:+ start:2167 stop:2640 length:474 start_codon:yes stop_codon:yes gene_type:complete